MISIINNNDALQLNFRGWYVEWAMRTSVRQIRFDYYSWLVSKKEKEKYMAAY